LIRDSKTDTENRASELLLKVGATYDLLSDESRKVLKITPLDWLKTH